MSVTFTFEGKTVECQSARLGLSVVTETWDGQAWIYGRELALQASLEIEVDEESGEDGAAAPDAHWHLHPIPADPFHSVWTDEAEELEAWFGNDAPALEDNRIELLGLEGEGVRLRWTASCEDEPMVVEGVIPFTGIAIRVHDPKDARPFLRQLWPQREWPEVDAEEIVDLGEAFAAERRVWHCFRYPLTGSSSD